MADVNPGAGLSLTITEETQDAGGGAPGLSGAQQWERLWTPHRMQYIRGENRRYNSSCIRRSLSMHPLIRSLSLIFWLRSGIKIVWFIIGYSKMLPVFRWLSSGD